MDSRMALFHEERVLDELEAFIVDADNVEADAPVETIGIFI